MRTITALLVVLVAGGATVSAQPPPAAGGGWLEIITSFPDKQPTGVAVSKSGRTFVNFPDWSDDHTVSVVELVGGKPMPYPNEAWNTKGAPSSRFVCVQSVYVDSADTLWILDPAAPRMQGTLEGGPKLLKVDLATNEVTQIVRFDAMIAPKKSYLNDVRVDPARNAAFITDSGLGAIVVVDLKTGNARRLLADHPSTKAEPGFKLQVGGRELIEQKTGKPPEIHADGIALDLKNGYLYYHALTARTLYRIKTEALLDESLPAADLAAKVEKLIETPAPDGMIAGSDGGIYLTDIENNAINRYDPVAKRVTPVIEDRQLDWPDSLSWTPDGNLAVTASQIENMPRFNNGKNARTRPYRVFKAGFSKEAGAVP